MGTRRVVAKVEWHPGELYARDGFIVTHLARPAERVVTFYNHRGTAEQRIKEGKGAIKWTRLAVMPFLRRQRRPSSAPRTGLQPRQFHADAGDAQNGRAVAANQPAREVDQDRRQGGEPRPLRHVPIGRGRRVAADLQAYPDAHRPTAGGRRPHEGWWGRMR
jgi:hypothetical protein